MYVRDLSNESFYNSLRRINRALKIRWRGGLFGFFKVFAHGSGRNTTIGASPKIINSRGILLGHNVGFGDLCRLECHYPDSNTVVSDVKIIIGDNTSFGDFFHIGAINSIHIGKNVLGGSKILIIDHDHGKCGTHLIREVNIAPRERELVSKGTIVIGDNVWIGEGAIILAGTTIGSGAVIAANSIVKGDVLPNKVYFNKTR